MKKISFSLVLLIVFQFVAFSQNKSIGIDAGFWSKSKLFEGYYNSANIKIPLSNTFEISPLFTFGETFPKGYNYVLITEMDESIGYEQGNLMSSYNNIHFTSMDVLILINISYLINKNNTKNKLLLGSGFGFKSYTFTKLKYKNVELNPVMTSLSIKKDNGFEPYYLKIHFNHKIKDNIYLGFDSSINSVDGEGYVFYGINFGVNF